MIFAGRVIQNAQRGSWCTVGFEIGEFVIQRNSIKTPLGLVVEPG
jgi:hypothetical protein